MASGKDKDFFEEQLPNSKVKSEIVSNYFVKWARIIKGQVRGRGDKLGYLDFFSGPGKYEDGADSTPLLILKKTIEDNELSKMLVAHFFDADDSNVEKLEEEIKKIPGIEKISNAPEVGWFKVDSALTPVLKEINLIPSLIFIDPFGYKEITLELISSVIKDWGCDCIFFFNYNRINNAVRNKFMKTHMDGLFGPERAAKLKEQVEGLNPDEREELIMRTFLEALRGIKDSYPIHFKFVMDGSEKTSHFLVFLSKHPRGYQLMKETMAANCSKVHGVPTYVFDPNGEKIPESAQLDLFAERQKTPIEQLEDALLLDFKGQTKSVEEIYFVHNIGRPYILSNYKTALLTLEQKGLIQATPNKRRSYKGRPTMGETVSIKFN